MLSVVTEVFRSLFFSLHTPQANPVTQVHVTTFLLHTWIDSENKFRRDLRLLCAASRLMD